MKNIQELIEQYPDSECINGVIYLVEDYTEDQIIQRKEAVEMIEAYFEGSEITKPHPSGAPWLEECGTLTGSQWLDCFFTKKDGRTDWDKAFDEIKKELKES